MPRRRPLSNIPINISTRRELSSDAKNVIYRRALAGESSSKIATAERIPKSTINYILQCIEQHNTVANLPWSGRPRIHNDQDKQRIIQQVRLSPKITYKDPRRSTGLKFSNKLLSGILKDHSIIDWHSKDSLHSQRLLPHSG